MNKTTNKSAAKLFQDLSASEFVIQLLEKMFFESRHPADSFLMNEVYAKVEHECLMRVLDGKAVKVFSKVLVYNEVGDAISTFIKCCDRNGVYKTETPTDEGRILYDELVLGEMFWLANDILRVREYEQKEKEASTEE